jgi:predicted ester cyclase
VTLATTAATATTPDQVFRRLIEEGFNQGRLEGLAEIVAEDLIENQVGAGSGLSGLKALITELREPFPDLELEIQDMVTAGEVVWARIRARGTNTGSWRGRPASGRPIDMTVIDVAHVVKGRIVEHWGVADRLTMLMQIGIPVGGRQG